MALLSPSPQPSPQGEGELSATLGAKGDPISLGASTAPSPWGEGWGEGDRDGRQTESSIATPCQPIEIVEEATYLGRYERLGRLVSFCIWRAEDYEALSRQAAAQIIAALASKPNLLLCAAGGSTPLRTYELLAENCAADRNRFARLRLVKLDEWGGLEMDDPGSCEIQFQTHLSAPLGVAAEHCMGFQSNPVDPEAESAEIRSRLAAEGPIDLCILGLGINGHIGMNEPAPALQPFAHVAQLSQESLTHSMLGRARKRPTYGLTLGMAEILTSRQILLLVSGATKRKPLERLLQRQITTEFPVSFLWLHPNWILGCDAAALPSIAA